MAVSGKLGGKVPVVNDVLLAHDQQIYSTTSLDENCLEFDFQTDLNSHVDLRQTYLLLKLKLVRGRGYKTYNSEEVKKELKEKLRADEKTTVEDEQEAPVSLFTHVNNIWYSIFSNVEVYIHNQEIYNSKKLYAHKSYISNNFKGAISGYKGILHCEGYDYEQFPDELMEAPLSELFFHKEVENA